MEPKAQHQILSKEVVIMQNEYTAVVKQEDDWWVGWIDRGNPWCKLPGKNLRRIERDFGGYSKRGIGI